MMKKILLLVVLFGVTNRLSADLGEGVLNLHNVPSPNAQDFGKYGEIPMDLYTGRANVSIPLYKTTQGGVPLNISLSYDTGGLLINQFPSWTGHGWTLNAGGCITRKMQGYYDEDENKSPNSTILKLVNYFKNTRQIEGSSIETIASNTTNSTEAYDYSPDIFMFSFMGKSGRFFLDHDKKWRVQSSENIKVEFNINDQSNFISPFFDGYKYGNYSTEMSKTIKGFTLIDENGIRYKFGGTADAIEYSMGFFNMETNDWIANSWYLTEIQDRFGNTLYKFTYNRGKYIVQIFNNEVNLTQSVNYGVWGFLCGVYGGGIYSMSNEYFPINLTLNAPVYLSRIETLDKNVIDFNLSDTICLKEDKDIYPSFGEEYCAYNRYCYYHKSGWYSYAIPYVESFAWNESTRFFYLKTHSYGPNYNRVDRSYVTKYWDQDARREIETNFSNNISIPHGVGWDNPLSVLSFNPLESINISSKQNGSTQQLRSIRLNYSKIGRLHITGVNMSDKLDNSVLSYKMEYNVYDKISDDYMTKKFDYWGYYNNSETTSAPNSTYAKYGMMRKLIYPTGGYTLFDYEQNTYSKYVKDNLYIENCTVPQKMTGGLRIKSLKNYTSENELSQTKEYSYNNGYSDTNKSSGQCYAEPTDIVSVELSAEYKSTLATIHNKKGVVPLTDSYHPHIGYTWVTETTDSVEKEYRFTNFEDYMDEQPYVHGVSTNSSIYNRNSELGFARGQLLSEKIKQGDKLKYSSQFTYNSLDKTLYVTSSTLKTTSYTVGCLYKLYFPKFDLKKKEETIYNEDGTSVTTITNYDMSYKSLADGSILLRKCNSETTSLGASYMKKEYTYLDTETTDYWFPMSKVKIYNNGCLAKTNVINYSSFTTVSNHLLPKDEYQYIGSDTLGNKVVTYDNYNMMGLLTQYTENGKAPVYLQWDAYGRLVQRKTINNITSFTTDYEYTADSQLKKVTSPNGYIMNYGYDDMGRLNSTSDALGTINTYLYNYRDK